MEFPFWLLATFLFLLGCCIGSFLNVVIWRLPHYGLPVTFLDKTGPLTLNFPPSHCPHCQMPIQVRHNIPVIGYLLLRGRCGHCREPVSARYPLVELGTGLIFLAIFAQQYTTSAHAPMWLGVPGLVLKECFAAVMLATAAIDADTFQIPLILPQMVMALAIAVGFLGRQPGLPHLADSGWVARAIWGGTLGLLAAFAGLKFGLLPRSFNESPGDIGDTAAAADALGASKHLPGGPSAISPPNAAGGIAGRLIFGGMAAVVSAAAFTFAHLACVFRWLRVRLAWAISATGACRCRRGGNIWSLFTPEPPAKTFQLPWRLPTPG